MVKDPVCNKMVDSKKAAGTSVYQGQSYYFCCTDCKTKFDKSPEKFVTKTSPAQSSGH